MTEKVIIVVFFQILRWFSSFQRNFINIYSTSTSDKGWAKYVLNYVLGTPKALYYSESILKQMSCAHNTRHFKALKLRNSKVIICLFEPFDKGCFKA